MSRLDIPDLGLATLDDMCSNTGMIASLDRDVPVIVEADTRFGGPMMVARTVEKYALAGVAALHIEDQTTTKRCGRILGKELVLSPVFASRIRAAAAARDALQSLGLDEAVARLRAAAGRAPTSHSSRR
ncbi:hypothetical protein NKR23_g2472 [Pleurostoma richardsiae]|uniref:methylisocitrate lyase n=1 Tax=Pleurostoma richardsiae TaxID=41990 RepID=A0AA38VYI2_9PEZI|nr:hypothetical protein NKR23_g2472 [Pleurostoma richardsiae]